jgi:hypothetical protein
MKKRKLLLIGVLIWNFNSLFGQSCGTPMPTNTSFYPQPQSARAYNYGENICIDVQFHIVRNSDSSLTFTPQSENAMLNELNDFFNPHQIFFNSVGVNFIDNTNYVTTSESETNQLVAIDNNPNALNYYIVDELWDVFDDNGNFVGFVAGTAVNIPSNHLVIRNDRVLTTTAPHEVGHCLDLLHTHETNRGVETINGSNCSAAGDLVCDTPADPRLRPTINVNWSCEYDGTGGYNPLTNNIMSYSFDFCRDEFTSGQGWRMRQAILNNSLLQPLLNVSCSISNIDWNYDNGAATCLNQTKTFSLTAIPTGTSVSWSATNNLTITSSNSNSVTIRLNNFDEEAIITGTLVINGLTYVFTLELEQLVLPTASKITLESFNSAPLVTGTFTNVTARYDWLIDVGQLGYTWEWIVPSSQVISSSPTHSYIHVSPLGNPTSIYIKTRACNECGSSEWKGKWFIVETPPTGCTNCPTRPGIIHY